MEKALTSDILKYMTQYTSRRDLQAMRCVNKHFYESLRVSRFPLTAIQREKASHLSDFFGDDDLKSLSIRGYAPGKRLFILDAIGKYLNENPGKKCLIVSPNLMSKYQWEQDIIKYNKESIMKIPYGGRVKITLKRGPYHQYRIKASDHDWFKGDKDCIHIPAIVLIENKDRVEPLLKGNLCKRFQEDCEIFGSKWDILILDPCFMKGYSPTRVSFKEVDMTVYINPIFHSILGVNTSIDHYYDNEFNVVPKINVNLKSIPDKIDISPDTIALCRDKNSKIHPYVLGRDSFLTSIYSNYSNSQKYLPRMEKVILINTFSNEYESITLRGPNTLKNIISKLKSPFLTKSTINLQILSDLEPLTVRTPQRLLLRFFEYLDYYTVKYMCIHDKYTMRVSYKHVVFEAVLKRIVDGYFDNIVLPVDTILKRIAKYFHRPGLESISESSLRVVVRVITGKKVMVVPRKKYTSEELDAMNVGRLKQICRDQSISGYSKLFRDSLIKSILENQK